MYRLISKFGNILYFTIITFTTVGYAENKKGYGGGMQYIRKLKIILKFLMDLNQRVIGLLI
ncbi:ion channel [Clostridium estertheticum]|uniref:ion channel n=2 Tax=Clostridium estertheticum TaxID=238834 RepID=UPI00398C59EF